MNAGWVSAIAGMAMVIGIFGGTLWRGGRRDGRIDTVLERLTDITEDHETRLRIVEQIRARGRRDH